MRKANWNRNIINGRLNQSPGQLRFPAAAIESEHEFVDVLLQVGAQQVAFQVGNDDVHCRQPFVDFFGRCDPCVVDVIVCQPLQGGEGIAADHGIGRGTLGELAHPLLIELIDRFSYSSARHQAIQR